MGNAKKGGKPFFRLAQPDTYAQATAAAKGPGH
jgi:hypothetical protein